MAYYISHGTQSLLLLLQLLGQSMLCQTRVGANSIKSSPNRVLIKLEGCIIIGRMEAGKDTSRQNMTYNWGEHGQEGSQKDSSSAATAARV